MAHRRGGANRFVRSLRVFLLFERVGSFRKIILPVLLADVFAYFSDRLGSDAGRVGTHISNEADGSFFAEPDALCPRAVGRPDIQPGGRERDAPAAHQLDSDQWREDVRRRPARLAW